MDSQSLKTGKAGWMAQFVFYLVLFALLISLGAYFLTGTTDAPTAVKPATQPSATPQPETPAGQAGHDAPQSKR
jgi:hypothetical protein